MGIGDLRKTYLGVVAAILVGAAAPPAQGQDAVGAIALTGSVSTIVDELRASVLEIIGNLDDAVSRNAFEIRQHLLRMIGVCADCQRVRQHSERDLTAVS